MAEKVGTSKKEVYNEMRKNLKEFSCPNSGEAIYKEIVKLVRNSLNSLIRIASFE